MESNIVRWKFRLASFTAAFKTLESAIADIDNLSDLEKDGIIQRFEFTFELSWKVMQDYLKHLGYYQIKGPRPVITQMAQDGLLDPFIWEEILTARNELSHIYDEKKSRIYLDKIMGEYFVQLNKFKEVMQTK